MPPVSRSLMGPSRRAFRSRMVFEVASMRLGSLSIAWPMAPSLPFAGTLVRTTAKGAMSKLVMPLYFCSTVSAMGVKCCSRKPPPSTSIMEAMA